MSLTEPPEQFTGYAAFAPSSIERWLQFEDGTILEALIYKPDDWTRSDDRDAMMFFFGGGWRQGSPWQFAPYAAHLARQGWVVVLPQYRVRATHGTTPIDSTLDARAAIRWVARHASELGIDPNRIHAGGGSAGAHLAAALPVTAAIDTHPDAADTPVPQSLVLFNPAANFAHPEGIGTRVVGSDSLGVDLETFLTVDPHVHATREYPPTLIMHGTADEIVPIAAIEDFAIRLRALEVKVHMVAFEGRQHGFFNLARGKDVEATLVHLDDFLNNVTSRDVVA